MNIFLLVAAINMISKQIQLKKYKKIGTTKTINLKTENRVILSITIKKMYDGLLERYYNSIFSVNL